MKTKMINKTILNAGIGLAMLCATGAAHSACSDTSIASNTPDVRYTVNDDGTVTDKLTHLIWMTCVIGLSGEDCKSGAEITFNWKSALQNQVLMNADGGFAGHIDWRLPNRKELASLIDNQCVSPAINETIFPNQSPSVSLWTATPDPNDDARSWSVNFRYGDIKRDRRTERKLIRLVRDPD